MSKYKSTWLPHLEGAHPESAYGNASCMYVMSLEGWRRGLDLKFKIGKSKNLLKSVKYTLSDGEVTHTFAGSRGDFVTSEAINICTNKGLTKDYMEAGGVPVPKGKTFEREATDEEIIAYSNEIGYPLVLKPSDSEGGGVGVITNIKNDDEMKDALSKTRGKQKYMSVIVERFFVGEDFRVYVLDGQVIGAFHRRAQSVVGDGKSTITKLLDKKNDERHASPFLAKKKIKMDQDMIDFLAKKGLSPDSVPADGERVFLRPNGAYFGERDSVNVTETLSPKMKEVAINAVKSIPGLPHGGVDMLIDLEKDECIVNEVNSRAQISNHVYPVEGEAVDIPKLILDYYFPHTKNRRVTDQNYYYDYSKVMNAFKNRTTTEVQIPPCPSGLLTTKRFVVKGSNFTQEYRKWLKKKATEYKLNGYVRSINKTSISVVVSGSDTLVNWFRDDMKKNSPKPTQITSITGKGFEKPIKVGGFELRKNPKVDTKQTAAASKPKQPAKKQDNSSSFKKLVKRVLRKVKRMVS